MSFSQIITQLAGGMGRSLLIFTLTLVFSLPLGLAVTAGRMSRWAPLKKLGLPGFMPLRLFTQFFISVMRGTPLMLQLMVVYYGPYYIFGLQISLAYQFYAVIIAFPSTMPPILPRSTGPGSSPSPLGNMKQLRCWGIPARKPFLRSFSRRW